MIKRGAAWGRLGGMMGASFGLFKGDDGLQKRETFCWK